MNPSKKAALVFPYVSLILFFALGAQAEIIVTTNADSGEGSLRQAVMDAAETDTITFNSALSGQAVMLTTGQILVSKNLTIDALELEDWITIDGNANGRIFEFAEGTVNAIKGLYMVNGQASASDTHTYHGGAIYINFGADLTLENITLSGNEANFGGAFYSTGGTVTVIDSVLSENIAQYGGGSFSEFGNLDVRSTTYLENTAIYGGGGIYNSSSIVNVEYSTLSGNLASDSGGGLYNDGGGTLVIQSSTIVGNTGTISGGGGIYIYSGEVQITNNTFKGNSAPFGGGVHLSKGALTIQNSTFSKNIASLYGGGIYRTDGTLNVENSIVACNTATGRGDDLFGGNISNGNNFTFSDPKLAPLGDYSGPTQTMPPLPGSPVIDASGTTALTVDQRGLTRVVGSAADIGAVEFQGSSDVTLFWNTDWDEDGLPFALENALGTDPNMADFNSNGMPTSYPPTKGNGIAFGFNASAVDYTTWVIRRSTDLSNPNNFEEVFRYDGNLTGNGDLTVTLNADSIEIEDETTPLPINTFYQLLIEQKTGD